MINEALTVFFTILIVVDPLGIVPIFLTLAGHLPAGRRISTIFKAGLIAFSVLCLFILLGNRILDFLGIHSGSFSIAGGILLFIVSIDMLLGAPRRTRITPQEMETQDIAVFPLGIPLLAGPGSITTILLFLSGTKAIPGLRIILVLSVLVTLLLAALAMRLSGFLLRILRPTGVSVLERLMGIILAGLSVEFVYAGMRQLGMI
jgi:multiple antibiotic resistance protein